MRAKETINENFKILATNNINTLPREDKLLEIPLVSSPDGTLPDPSLLLFYELEISTSNSTAPVIDFPVTSLTPT